MDASPRSVAAARAPDISAGCCGEVGHAVRGGAGAHPVQRLPGRAARRRRRRPRRCNPSCRVTARLMGERTGRQTQLLVCQRRPMASQMGCMCLVILSRSFGPICYDRPCHANLRKRAQTTKTHGPGSPASSLALAILARAIELAHLAEPRAPGGRAGGAPVSPPSTAGQLRLGTAGRHIS